MSQRFHRRRKLNFSIKRAFQLRLILRVLMIAMAALVLAVIGFGLYSNREISGSFIHGDIQVRNFFELLLPTAIGIVSVGTIVALVFALFFPLRLAGPLYRIEKEVERIRKGDLTVQLRLRQGDELKDLADAVNQAVEALRGQIERMKRELSDLSSSGDEWLGIVDRDGIKTDQIQRFVEKIKSLEKELQRLITDSRPPG